MQRHRQFVYILASLSLLFPFAGQISAQIESLKEAKKRIEKTFEKRMFFLQVPVDTTDFQIELPKSERRSFNPATPYLLEVGDVKLKKKRIDLRARRVYIFQDSKRKLHRFRGRRARYRIKWREEISSPNQWQSILTKTLHPIDSGTGGQDMFWPPDLPEEFYQYGHGPSRELTPGIFTVGTDITKPTCEYCPDPDYPEAAKRQRMQGKVGLVVVITEEGYIAGIRLQDPAGQRFQELDWAAIVAVAKWRFKPATHDGKPIRIVTSVEVKFNIY